MPNQKEKNTTKKTTQTKQTKKSTPLKNTQIKQEKKNTSNNKKTKTEPKQIRKEEPNQKKNLTKKNLIYLLILIIDICLVIYSARQNIINYVTLEGSKSTYIGTKHNLFLGRNYITLMITLVVSIYVLILNKFYFKNKMKLSHIILGIILLLIINCIFFYLFTIKVY